MTEPSPHSYIIPKLPNCAINLEAITEPGDEWAVGPFDPKWWDVLEDNTMMQDPGNGRPFRLRVRSQDGNVLHANNGDDELQDYRIVPACPASDVDQTLRK